jgi:predicted Holliday junction resolvase-like endonuclease
MIFTLKRQCLIVLCLLIILMLRQEQVACQKLNLRKFAVSFGRDRTSKLTASANAFEAKVKENKDARKKIAEDLEKKREKIYREQLLSRVSGSVFRDLYNRF